MADSKDPLAPFKAAKLAEYDAKSPPDELPFTQLKKLLVDGLPPDDGALLIQIFKDAVNEGDILPSQKTGTGFNWPNHIGTMTQIIKSKSLANDEIIQAETGGYPGATVTLWDYDGVSYPAIAWIQPRHPWEDERLPPHKPPAAKIEYHFTRDAVQNWFDAMDFNPSDLLAAWLNAGELKGADDSTKPKKQGQRKTNLKKVVLNACKHYGQKPSFAELIKYIQDELDETGIIQDWTEDNVSWVTTKGEIKDTTYKTLQNMLASINYP